METIEEKLAALQDAVKRHLYTDAGLKDLVTLERALKKSQVKPQLFMGAGTLGSRQ